MTNFPMMLLTFAALAVTSSAQEVHLQTQKSVQEPAIDMTIASAKHLHDATGIINKNSVLDTNRVTMKNSNAMFRQNDDVMIDIMPSPRKDDRAMDMKTDSDSELALAFALAMDAKTDMDKDKDKDMDADADDMTDSDSDTDPKSNSQMEQSGSLYWPSRRYFRRFYDPFLRHWRYGYMYPSWYWYRYRRFLRPCPYGPRFYQGVVYC